MPIGFTLPFAQSTGSVGYFEFTSTELDAIKQNLKSLLLTNWGERVMHYYFGCNLREFLFSNLGSGELKQRIADRILDQIQKWMPFLSIDMLTITFPEEDPILPEHSVSVAIRFRITSRPDQIDLVSVVATP